MQKTLERSIRSVMKKNRREKHGHTYTIPSPELYPFQWFWDSCFHATILSYFDIEAAHNELRSVTYKPLSNGLLPHIIYWEDDYRVTNWGREMRGDIISNSWGTDGTSAITQPPVIATTVWEMHMRNPDKSFLEELYPALRQYYMCLLGERDPDLTGLVGIINPDESGEDNSPRFDHALGLPRNHTDHENLDKRIELMEQNVICEFDAYDCMRDYFWIKDVSFNCIYIKGLKSLSHIADEIGAYADREIFKQASIHTRDALRNESCKDGVCYSLEGREFKKVRINTWNIFMPLYAHVLEAEEAQTLIEEQLLNPEMFWLRYPVPSVAKSEKCYTQDDFWRGPTWMAINWFVYKGLKNYGYNEAARTLKRKTISLLERSGFREYYNPETGEGIGAKNFTWGGLVIDMNS